MAKYLTRIKERIIGEFAKIRNTRIKKLVAKKKKLYEEAIAARIIVEKLPLNCPRTVREKAIEKQLKLWGKYQKFSQDHYDLP